MPLLHGFNASNGYGTLNPKPLNRVRLQPGAACSVFREGSFRAKPHTNPRPQTPEPCSPPEADRIWLRVRYHKLPIYPILYLLKGDYKLKSKGLPKQPLRNTKLLFRNQVELWCSGAARPCPRSWQWIL